MVFALKCQIHATALSYADEHQHRKILYYDILYTSIIQYTV